MNRSNKGKAIKLRVVGHWVNNRYSIPECEGCGYRPNYDMLTRFCPECGLEMENGKSVKEK